MPYVTLGNLGQHHHGHHGHHGGPIFAPQYYNPGWSAPSPYLVIIDESGNGDEDTKKKKKKRLVDLKPALDFP